MTNPISGPTRTVWDTLKLYLLRDRYAQPRPRDLVLPYNMYQSKNRVNGFANPDATRSSSNAFSPDMIPSGPAQLMAYEKFKNAISDTASMGENTFELHKSLQTIEHKALQLANAYRDIRRRDFKSAMETLWWGVDQKTHKHAIKQGGSNWLEFHLGIAPVIGDVYNAIQVLQQPIKSYKVRGRGRDVDYQQLRWIPFSWSRGHEIEIKYQYTCEVSVTNPNLWLANSLGIVNPFQVAWQLIPMSFVVDWFVNVESFLGSFTDLLGLNVQKAASTLTYSGTSCQGYYSPGNAYGYTFQYCVDDICGMRRSVGITTPSLQLRPFRLPGWQRALTAISLLLPQIKSIDRKLPTRKSWGYGGSM